MLPIKLFRLVFCLFRFNETSKLSFGIEAKQPKQTFLFRIVPKLVSETSSKDTLVVSLSTTNGVDVRLYTFPQTVWTGECISFHNQQRGLEGVSLFTANNVDGCDRVYPSPLLAV